MRAFLNGQHGSFPVPAGSSILGRGQDCGLRVDDPRLSRHHARLLHDGDVLIIEDIGSTNGVVVNGERIQGKKNLISGDTVVCGPCVFTVALDPTQRASASELLPGTDRNPDPRKTDEMDPLDLPGSDRLPIRNPHHQASSATAPAASPPSRGDASSRVLKPDSFGNDVSSDALKPNEQQKVETGPLIHRGDTTPRGHPINPPPPPPPPPTRKASDHLEHTGLIPTDFNPAESMALQPDFLTAVPSGPAPAWKRAVAGIADGVTVLLLMMLLGLPLMLGGYGWSLTQAGAVMDDGLPQLPSSASGQAASGKQIVISLFQRGGLVRAGEVADELMRADDQQPFLTLFASSALGVLFALVGGIVYLIGTTVIHGAPYWHRRLGLEIVEHPTGYQPTWGRTVTRWLAFTILWPLAPLALGLDRRALHDVIGRCAVRGRRKT
jgi:hypothetical protein